MDHPAPPPPAAATIPPAVARAAVHWLLTLDDDSAPPSERTRQQWHSWLQADPLHAQAWQRIASLDAQWQQQLHGLPASVARQALTASGHGRRHALRLALLLTAGTGGLLALQQSGMGQPHWQRLAADLATATGEQRSRELADGTRLWLNTATAVDLHYSATERLIVLRAGEILVHSAPDNAPDAATGQPRPLRVRTAEGLVRAIGTRFTVRQHAQHTSVAVLEGAVELHPVQAPQDVLRLDAGEQATLERSQAGSATPLPEGAGAWHDGMLVVNDMPLPDFLAELSRYRTGLLRCAANAAGLRVSGAYPLADTDRVLNALTRALPVQLQPRTRWWVTVERRS
ncbi:FecR domain-containing protein [Comamonas sp. UBA7528]|uniref:FecR domain-containing protein n=1 Tax=Comamonas sp. UBA7528 TaxID=1946391 RepID=UPI0025C1AB88|nr:FecR domain-containing protein [Comamonas sp. UBA7528]